MKTFDYRLDPEQFFEPESIVWIVHCREVQKTSVSAVRFEMCREDAPGGQRFVLLLTGYRLPQFNHETEDWYFRPFEVYATCEAAEEQARWHSAETVSEADWKTALGSYNIYRGGDRRMQFFPDGCELGQGGDRVFAIRHILCEAWKRKGLIYRDVATLHELVKQGTWAKTKIPALLRIFNQFGIYVEGEAK